MGVYGPKRSGVGHAVQLWFLQPDAYLYPYRSDRDGVVPSEDMVHLLPYGDDDTGNM